MLKVYKTKGIIEAGTDEAGRGCLAGPVVAAAVILNPKKPIDALNDSKKLTEKKRYELRPIIEESALAWAVGVVHEGEIDKINILNASFLAMHRAIEQLQLRPEHILVDGNRFNPFPDIEHSCIIKGDGIFQSIAAASVLAKTYRDDIMLEYHKQFPVYDWDNNKGYPTKKHRAAIKQFGPCKLHRNSFKLLPIELKLDL